MDPLYEIIANCISCFCCYPTNLEYVSLNTAIKSDYHDSTLHDSVELLEPEELSPIYLTDRDLMKLYQEY